MNEELSYFERLPEEARWEIIVRLCPYPAGEQKAIDWAMGFVAAVANPHLNNIDNPPGEDPEPPEAIQGFNAGVNWRQSYH